jgi:hypothetical protein
MKKALLVIGVLLISTSFFSGCLNEKTGTLTLQLTDAPDLNITALYVNITKVDVHRAAAGNLTNASWETVVNESQIFNLTALINATEVLGSEELQVGKYTQIRLYISEANVTIDGEIFELDIPSETIKLVSGFWILPDQETTLTLDFDAKESVHKTGNDEYKLKPTIKIIEE